MPSPPRTRVVVVDDHELVREGLKQIVEAEPDMHIVGEAANAEQAVQVISDLRPDVVLMDVSLAGANGVGLTADLLRAHPSVRIVGVSRHNESAVMDAMLQAGALGYVLKQTVPSHLPAAIRRVASGMKYVGPQQEARGDRSKIHARSVAHHQRPTLPLTPQEEDILRLVALSHTHEQIAKRLGVSIEETMSLKAAAMKKAGLVSRVHVMTYAQERGWLSKRNHRLATYGNDPD